MDQLKAAWRALSPAQRAAISGVIVFVLAVVAFCGNLVGGGTSTPTPPPTQAPPTHPATSPTPPPPASPLPTFES